MNNTFWWKMSTDTSDRKLVTSMHNKTLVQHVFIIMQTYTWNKFKTKKTRLHQTLFLFFFKLNRKQYLFYIILLFINIIHRTHSSQAHLPAVFSHSRSWARTCLPAHPSPSSAAPTAVSLTPSAVSPLHITTTSPQHTLRTFNITP